MTETATFDPTQFGGLDLPALARVVDAQFQMKSAGTCAHPIRLVGSREVIEVPTGRLLDSTGEQQITVSCGNRRASVCAYCSTLYKFDAYNVVVAGMRGGRDVPETVAGHPRLFVTLTAPSFGPVHLGPGSGPRNPGNMTLAPGVRDPCEVLLSHPKEILQS